MSAAPDVAAAIVARISGALTPAGSWVLGTNVFSGPESFVVETGATIPGVCIFVVQYGGDAPIYLKDPTLGRMTGHRVQVTCRHESDNWDGALALAEAIHAALDANPPTGYWDCQAISASPNPLKRDDDGRIYFVENFVCRQRT